MVLWGAWCELNWLNTVISTMPITIQIARFLNRLFKGLSHVGIRGHSRALSVGLQTSIVTLLARQQVGFRTTVPGGSGFPYLQGLEHCLHRLAQLHETGALKHFDEHIAAGFQMAPGEIDGQFRQVHRSEEHTSEL